MIVALPLLAAAACMQPIQTEFDTVDYGPYEVRYERNMCHVGFPRLTSKGPRIVNATEFRMTVATRGALSAAFRFSCPPVGPMGNTACKVTRETYPDPHNDPGLGCPLWEDFRLLPVGQPPILVDEPPPPRGAGPIIRHTTTTIPPVVGR